MKTYKYFLTLLGLFLGFAAVQPAAAQQGGASPEAPDALIKRISQDVLEIARTDARIQAGDHQRVMEVVRTHILPHVDFERMTTLAVGRYWRESSPEQRQRLVEEFRDLLVYTYSGAISQVKDQRVEFRPFRADPADTEVEVKSRVLQSRGEPIQLNYRLEKTSDGWKIYDVNVLGAWLVESYRNSFATEIGKNGIDGLINVLSERNKRLANAATRNGKTS